MNKYIMTRKLKKNKIQNAKQGCVSMSVNKKFEYKLIFNHIFIQ